MEFINAPMRWDNAGTEPPESLKNNGWEANQKPPANYFNRKWYNDYKVQKELQEAVDTIDETISKPSEEFMLNKDNWSAASGGNTIYQQVVSLSNYEPTDKVLVSIKHNIAKSQLKDVSEKNFRVNALSSAGALTLYIDDLPTTHIYIVVSYLGKCTGGSLVTTFPYTPYPTKELIELGNVDNTSDEDKPVSTPMQEALDCRFPFAICTTAGDTQNKIVNIPNFTISDGSWFLLRFTEDNTISTPYLSVNGAVGDIYFGNPDDTSGILTNITANTLYLVYYDEANETYYFTDLTIKISPSVGSTSLITSGGVYSALQDKASTNHKHSADDITSGTFPISSGGTGATTVEKARVNLGLASVAASGKYNDLNNKPYTAVSTVSELEAAVSTTSQGGKVFLLPGTYEINSIIKVGKSGVVIEGAGIDTVLKMGASGYIQFFGDYSVLRDVCITRDVGSSNPLVDFDGSAAEGGFSKGILIDNVNINCDKVNASEGFFKMASAGGTGEGLRFNSCTINTNESNELIFTSSGSISITALVFGCYSNESVTVPSSFILGGNFNITAG